MPICPVCRTAFTADIDRGRTRYDTETCQRVDLEAARRLGLSTRWCETCRVEFAPRGSADTSRCSAYCRALAVGTVERGSTRVRRRRSASAAVSATLRALNGRFIASCPSCTGQVYIEVSDSSLDPVEVRCFLCGREPAKIPEPYNTLIQRLMDVKRRMRA